jgi:DNA-binding SARP family transcriptional activator
VITDELDALEFEGLCRAAGAALRASARAEAADAAERALGLWRGEPLADVPSQLLRDSAGPYLEQLRVNALEDRAEARLQLGWHEQLVPGLRELAREHPLRERFCAQLMLALYRCGRQAEALEAYRGARRALAGQLGIEPGPPLGQLIEGRHDPRLVRHREGPPLRPARLAAAHLTIMPGHHGLVSQSHRHCLIGPVSPCSTTEGYLRPTSHTSLTERAS